MYKVVRKVDNRFFSAAVIGKFEVEYKINEWSEPSIGNGIFVFDLFENAVRYIELCYSSIDYPKNLALFSCDVENTSQILTRAWVGSEEIQKFWADYNITRFPVGYPVPRGTLLAGKVMLLEQFNVY